MKSHEQTTRYKVNRITKIDLTQKGIGKLDKRVKNSVLNVIKWGKELQYHVAI